MTDKKIAGEKEKLIKKEVKRITTILSGIDENKLAAVRSVIENAAFMSVSMKELQTLINEKGYTCEYDSGKQTGKKKTPEFDAYIAMSKNHAAAIKLLSDLAPPKERKRSSLQEMLLRGGED
ncbi:hypothetical protein AGMMS49975_20860 [Clostridia bacterium]|nr:hypothetical protein AGMMS49975_20860 [Clostridia bacterium]GHU74700.1 hypothetical protein FACS1894188_03760 [Clostridia bacterium]